MSTIEPSPIEIEFPLNPPELPPNTPIWTWKKPITIPHEPIPIEIKLPLVLPLRIKIGTVTFVVPLALSAAEAETEPVATES
jgi:hypothetical protein